MIRLAFGKLGVRWETEGDDILVPSRQALAVVPDLGGAIPEIKTNVWPAFPTDLTSIALTVATQATGTVLFHDWMYSGRMYFTDKLVSMGARIILCDPYRCLVQGPSPPAGRTARIARHSRRHGDAAGRPVRARPIRHPQHRPDRARL